LILEARRCVNCGFRGNAAVKIGEGDELQGAPTRVILKLMARKARKSVDAQTVEPRRVFLLSPANAAGRRAKQLASGRAKFDLALRLRREGAALSEIFSFISGLYFRGKTAYSQKFARAPREVPGAFVITACGGLVPGDSVMTLSELQQICSGEIDLRSARYLQPLLRDARKLAARAGSGCEFILLGSIATPKYVEPLLEVFGERLFFPADFVGRGDMSRGGLMLRSARSGVELEYVPIATAVRHGTRPPKLPKLPRVALRALAAGMAR
jgi:hypothetical protein